MAVPNATAAALLGFLHEAPMSGWDLARTAQLRVGDFWRITQSQVYRELNNLAAAGYVTAGRSGPRDRVPYKLTASGRRAFRTWLSEDPGPEQIRMPLLLALHFGKHQTPARIAGMLTAHRALHEQNLTRYCALREAVDEATADPYVLATLEFGLTYERAVLTWFDQLDLPLGND